MNSPEYSPPVWVLEHVEDDTTHQIVDLFYREEAAKRAADRLAHELYGEDYVGPNIYGKWAVDNKLGFVRKNANFGWQRITQRIVR